MNPDQYIIYQLESLKLKKGLSFKKEDIEKQILYYLMSKKYRKFSTNPEYYQHIKNAINLSNINNQPIKLTIVFGGYKLWSLEETPVVDWAELFSLIYYSKWLTPICEIYEPGVWLDFFSDDIILEKMDNIPVKDTQRYLESFRELLRFIKPFLPNNLNITLNRVGDQYANYEDFKKELEESIKKISSQIGGLPVLTPEQEALVELNVKLKPGQSDDPKWKEKVFLIHEGYAIASKRRPYYRNPEKIFIITKKMKDSIAVGTTKTSVAKFWCGVGALIKRKDDFIETVLSPKQLKTAKFHWKETSISNLKDKNFNKIRIIDTN